MNNSVIKNMKKRRDYIFAPFFLGLKLTIAG